MSRHCTALITGNTGEQTDTQARARRSLVPRPIPTWGRAQRHSLVWFGKLALAWFAASAVAGFALAYWGTP